MVQAKLKTSLVSVSLEKMRNRRRASYSFAGRSRTTSLLIFYSLWVLLLSCGVAATRLPIRLSAGPVHGSHSPSAPHRSVKSSHAPQNHVLLEIAISTDHFVESLQDGGTGRLRLVKIARIYQQNYDTLHIMVPYIIGYDINRCGHACILLSSLLFLLFVLVLNVICFNQAKLVGIVWCLKLNSHLDYGVYVFLLIHLVFFYLFKIFIYFIFHQL